MSAATIHDRCESIDASVFSGDMLFDDEQRAELKDYAARWLRAIHQHEVGEAGPAIDLPVYVTVCASDGVKNDDGRDATTAAFLNIHGSETGSDDGGPPDSDRDTGGDGGSDGEGSDLDVHPAGRTEQPKTVKYRSPNTGETWSGRGQQPRWVKAALAAGKTLEDLAFDPATA